VTAVLVLVSFVMSCATFIEGVRAGHGSATLVAHMTWGALTLIVQLFAACVATIHARRSEQQIAMLEAALVQAGAGSYVGGGGPASVPEPGAAGSSAKAPGEPKRLA